MFCKILFIIFYFPSSKFVYHSISEFFVQVFILVRKFLIQSIKKFIPVFDKFFGSLDLSRVWNETLSPFCSSFSKGHDYPHIKTHFGRKTSNLEFNDMLESCKKFIFKLENP